MTRDLATSSSRWTSLSLSFPRVFATAAIRCRLTRIFKVTGESKSQKGVNQYVPIDAPKDPKGVNQLDI